MPFSFVNSRNCSDLWIISTSTGNKPTAKLSTIVKKQIDKVEESEHETETERIESIKKPVEKIIEKVNLDFKEDDVSDTELEDADTIV
jgi:hypothetical protein